MHLGTEAYLEASKCCMHYTQLSIEICVKIRQGRQCTYNVTLRGSRANIVAVEKQ